MVNKESWLGRTVRSFLDLLLVALTAFDRGLAILLVRGRRRRGLRRVRLLLFGVLALLQRVAPRLLHHLVQTADQAVLLVHRCHGAGLELTLGLLFLQVLLLPF